MKLKFAVTCIALLASVPAIGQDAAIVGKYSGGYNSNQGTQIRIDLNIKSVENGVVKGTAERFTTARRGGSCAGEYEIEGTLKGNVLSVRSPEKGGAASDCAFRYTGTVEGNKLVGKFGSNELELTK